VEAAAAANDASKWPVTCNFIVLNQAALRALHRSHSLVACQETVVEVNLGVTKQGICAEDCTSIVHDAVLTETPKQQQDGPLSEVCTSEV
jgi:hypothetical protein